MRRVLITAALTLTSALAVLGAFDLLPEGASADAATEPRLERRVSKLERRVDELEGSLAFLARQLNDQGIDVRH